MKDNPILRYSMIVLAFVVLIIGYIYFNEESLKASGQSSAQDIADLLQDGDTEFVEVKLREFVGGFNPESDEDFRQALVSLNYVDGLIEEGQELRFVGGDLVDGEEYRNYGAAYEVQAPQGGEDYLLITMRREEGAWVLANVQLAATNPFPASEN